VLMSLLVRHSLHQRIGVVLNNKQLHCDGTVLLYVKDHYILSHITL
jgi:hypothetical protein